MVVETRRETPASPPRHLQFVLGFIIAIGPVSVDMYLPAFPTITDKFGPSAAQLTLTAYLVGLAAGQMPWGLLADRFGRRRSLAAGLVVYTGASLGCACVPLDSAGLSIFCLFRLLAGWGAAASIVMPRTIVSDVAKGPAANALLSQVMKVMSVAPVIAPALGSVVFRFTGWRTLFVLAAAYGVASLVLLFRFLPQTLPQEGGIAFGALPTLRLCGGILRDRRFSANALIGGFVMCALFAFLAGSPRVLMVQFVHTELVYGAIQAFLSVGILLFFQLNTYLVRKDGPPRAIGFLDTCLVHGGGAPRVISLGILVWLAASSYLMVLAWSPSAGAPSFILGFLVFGLGFSFIPSNAQVEAVSGHQAHVGTATALMSTLQYSAGAVAGALVGALAHGTTAKPMAGIMLVCALGAAAAACLRPRTAA